MICLCLYILQMPFKYINVHNSSTRHLTPILYRGVRVALRKYYRSTNKQVINVSVHFRLTRIVGLSEQQVISRVHRVQRQQYNGDLHGAVELPPLSLVRGQNIPFFQFHYVTPKKLTLMASQVVS
jgi:hypothetical protein